MDSKLKVLLVDDDDGTNYLSKMVLNQVQINNVDAVRNGREACSYLSKVCPDLIFLDVNMNVMNGWEFLEEKVGNKLCARSKVIMLSSSALEEDKIRAGRFNCVIDYIEKPLTVEKARAVFKQFVEISNVKGVVNEKKRS